jgi:hypothetical protein
VLRLLWAGEAPAGTQLFGAPPPDGAARTLWTSDEGDTLELKPAPPGLPDAPPPARSGLAAWLRPAPADPARALRREVSAVLWAAPPGATPPGGLARLQRPLLVLRTGSAPAGAGELSLQALHDGWLADGRLLAALDAALADDPRWRRLSAAWRARQAARLCETAGALARLLEDTAADREPVLERDREGASAALLQRLQARLAALGVDGAGPAALAERPAPTLRGRVPEGRAAIVGGVLSGALAGLKADVATGGLTMGAGALTGGVLGALGAAGAARGLNAVRGSERPAVEWDDAALATLGRALLAHAAAALPGAAGAGAAERAAAAWPAPPSGRRTPDAAALAAALAGATGGPAWPAA